MISISKGLIIDEPWIDLILQGKKTWEMRATSTNQRGWFALIRKGSGTVIGAAFLDRVSGPYEDEALLNAIDCHRVPESHFTKKGYNWRYAWHLSNIKPLPEPVRYRHKSGAVIWVKLEPEVTHALQLVLQSECTDANPNKPLKSVLRTRVAQTGQLWEPTTNERNGQPLSTNGASANSVPVASDGSLFTPAFCNSKGIYTVGSKGEEQKYSEYNIALAHLKKMPTAKWRRPNKSGNWGIVSAVKWIEVE